MTVLTGLVEAAVDGVTANSPARLSYIISLLLCCSPLCTILLNVVKELANSHFA